MLIRRFYTLRAPGFILLVSFNPYRPCWPPFSPCLQPPLADAEAVRDQIISRLFEQLGNQGLDAHHPFNAFGDKEEEKRGSLRTLMSLGRSKSTDKVRAVRVGRWLCVCAAGRG
jgi:hypothetical protein